MDSSFILSKGII